MAVELAVLPQRCHFLNLPRYVFAMAGLWSAGGNLASRHKRVIHLSTLIVLILLLSASYLLLSWPKNESKSPHQSPQVTIRLKKVKNSTLTFQLRSDYRGPLHFSQQFANVRPYLKLVGGDRTNTIDYGGGWISYEVQFPIFWSRDQPYAVFENKTGIVEAPFIMPRLETASADYEINFSSLQQLVFNSRLGAGPTFYGSQRLLESYFVFGPRSRTTRRLQGINVNILADDQDFTSDIYELVSYYTETFGLPGKVAPNYTIIYADARCFASRPSGFFLDRKNRRYYAHELFHLWQPGSYNCSHPLLYKEGLARFMELYAQHKAGLINQSVYQRGFQRQFAQLSQHSNLSSYYYLQPNQLYQLRKERPELYNLLVYYKGSLVWKLIANEHDVEQLFKNYLAGGRCETISSLLTNYEQRLYERIKRSDWS